MKKILVFVILLVFFGGSLQAQPQKINIDVEGIPLNRVFFTLRDTYGFEFTFNDRLLSGYKITAHRTFESRDEAVSFLLKGLPFSFEKNGNVFVIYSQDEKKKPEAAPLQVSGQVVESGTFEPLPFSYIVINNRQIQSDQNGNFNFITSADTTLNLQILHLGYSVYDTIFSHSLNRKFFLHPSVRELGEVKIEGFTVDKSTLIGDAPGAISINHTIAPYLPGYGDNSVFTVLRLLPGMLASGEQSSDLMVWGSYESQTKVELDGFTIFDLKNHNDEIGVVNPMLVKNIRIFKGAYGAGFDDRVGGIVQISGKNGNQSKPGATLNINNSTANLMGELPLGKKSSLLASYRQTYYDLYNPATLNMNGNSAIEQEHSSTGMDHAAENMVDVLVVPDYRFNDINLKYSYRDEYKSTFTAVFYHGGDKYGYNVDGNYNNHQVINSLNEQNRQNGGSLVFTHQAGKRHLLETKINYADFYNSTSETNSTSMTGGEMHGIMEHSVKTVSTNNKVSETGIEISDHFSVIPENNFETGIGWQSVQADFQQTLSGSNPLTLKSTSQKGFAYLQNTVSVLKKLKITPGIRAVYETLSGGFYAEPKLSVVYELAEPFKMYAAWGKYHQFLSKVSFVDENGNYNWHWVNSDGNSNPVLASTHRVGGISYNENDFIFSAEGYYKTTSGITRYFSQSDNIGEGFYSGKSRSYGIDLYLKKEYKKNVAWISYTLGKTEENLSFDEPGFYRPAPNDQRHEFKVAGIYNLKSFYFSASYVYGSGFEILKNYSTDNSIPSYSRLDAGLVYKFSRRKIFGNIGISVLNVLNHQNIRYDNLKRVETGTDDFANIYSGAIPFSPTLFLKLGI